MSGAGAVLRFELVRRARWRPMPAAAALYAGVVACGYAFAGGGFAESVAIHAEYGLLAFALNAWFGVDRELGFDACLAGNLVGTGTWVVAKTAATGLVVLAAAGLVGAVTLAGTGGAGEAALWHALRFLLLGGWLLPLLLVVELGMESRLAAIGAFVVYLALALSAVLVHEETAFRVLGLRTVPHRLDSLDALAWRGAVVGPALAGLVLPLVRRGVAGPGSA